ncbi:MAG: penicillin-binding transpeptidase domain-containing protein [Merdibacter sp.]
MESAMSASWVQEGMFVPVKTISAADYHALSDQLDTVAGISVQSVSGRVYPYAQTCAHLVGYVQTASAQDLEEHADEGYTQKSLIGKSGLEAVYEDELRARDGVRIVVLSASGQEKEVVAESAAQDGKDIVTTIDLDVQQTLYEGMGDDEGAAVAMDAQTGEVLALVSTPSYDPNDFANGMDSEEWETLSSDARNPYASRYQSAYCPGSTFKAITAAIAPDNGTITADTAFEKTGMLQKDSSWGDHYVTTTHLYDEPSNLANALRYSDTVSFAQLPLRSARRRWRKAWMPSGSTARCLLS